jgi:membrane-associated phospholipid phosphatase/predicted protein tyrosine phosphatase
MKTRIAMKPRFRDAGATSAVLCGLFLVVYSGCNWITARRHHVGSFYFAWERHIPFVPAMILPYMSIDLFFIAAPFLASSDRELRTLRRRIAMAIILAGVCFLLLPLKFAFDRPHIDGFLGLIFNNFRGLDAPYNEFPSLHIALWVILADIYDRHWHGLLWWLAAFWFTLMAASPLLTYQHHAIDVLGGLALAALCFHFAGDQPLRQTFIPNRRIALYYAAGSAILTWLSLTLLPWSYAMVWPAFSMALVAAGYVIVGPEVFRKQQGAHPWTTWVLLAPVLLGQRLSLVYYARKCRAYDRLTSHLWIGRRLTRAEAQRIRAAGVTAVVDLTAEFSEVRLLRDLAYLQLSILDLTPPTPEQIDEAVAFINQHAGRGIVYLHCKVGYSRTAAVAGAYLLATGKVTTAEQAINLMRCARPTLIVRPEATAALRMFQARLSPRTSGGGS